MPDPLVASCVRCLPCGCALPVIAQRDKALAEIGKAIKRPPVPPEAYSLRATLNYNNAKYAYV